GHDEAALALADGGQQVHHAAGVILFDGFQFEPLIGIERRQVVEEDLVAGFLGRLEVDGIPLDEGEVALAFLWRPDLPADGVAGAQIETADLAGRDVDIVGAGQVVVLRSAQEAEAVGQALQHAFAEDEPAFFGLGLQDLEDQLLFAQTGGAGDVHILGNLVELHNAHVLQLDQVERGSATLGGLGGSLFAALRAEVSLGSGRNDGRLDGRRRHGGGRRQGGRDRLGFGGGFGFGWFGLNRLGVDGLGVDGLDFRRRSRGGRSGGSLGPVRFFGGRLFDDRLFDDRLIDGLWRGGFAGGCFFGGFFGLFLRWVVVYRGWRGFIIFFPI